MKKGGVGVGRWHQLKGKGQDFVWLCCFPQIKFSKCVTWCTHVSYLGSPGMEKGVGIRWKMDGGLGLGERSWKIQRQPGPV